MARLLPLGAYPSGAYMGNAGLELPREAWQPAGQLLRRLTGEDFGPRAGDGIGETLAAQKQWQAWRREKGQRAP